MEDLQRRFDETIETLRSLVAEIVAPAVLPGAPDRDLVTSVRGMEAVGRLADAGRLFCAGEAAHRSRKVLGTEGLARRLGCATPAELLERTAHILPATARARIRLASVTRPDTGLSGSPLPAQFDEVAAGLASGRLGVDSAVTIVSVLSRVSAGLAPDQLRLVAQAEHELVCAAVGSAPAPGEAAFPPVTPMETAIQAATWEAVLNPDGPVPAEKVFETRSFSLHRAKGGLVPVSGMLLPETAGQVKRVFDSLTNPRQSLTFLTAEERAAIEREDGPKDPRSRAQRQHDALATVFGVAGRSEELPTLGGASATMVVQVLARDDEVGRNGRNGGSDAGSRNGGRPRDADGRGALGSMGREGEGDQRGSHADDSMSVGVGHVDSLDVSLPADAVDHVSCANGIQRVVIRHDGKIMSLGTTERTFNRGQRRAIIARDGGCIICGEAAWACEVHHHIGWARDRRTHVDNGVLLCWFHHRTIDTSGWRIRMVEGCPQIMPPPWLGPQVWMPTRGSATRRIAALAERLRQ
ncbi:HNH endonuclease signature motif containing protein [Glaciibacter flavus]|uniref:HNH endonuclease signature motif containing protein n=1 Tax=Orlajensenia flava TaxID=2565934 RepID=UPI003B003D9F